MLRRLEKMELHTNLVLKEEEDSTWVEEGIEIQKNNCTVLAVEERVVDEELEWLVYRRPPMHIPQRNDHPCVRVPAGREIMR